MLFELKKLATVPFLPLYFTLITGCIGLLLLWLKHEKRWARIFVGLSVGSLAVFSNHAIAAFLTRPLENKYSPMPEFRRAEDVPPALRPCVAIVVLGGGHADSPTLSRVNQLSSSSLSRVAEAVRISRWLPNAKLIVSGHHNAEISHAQVLGEAEVSLGADPMRIVRMDDPRDTEDEIAELSRRVGTAPVALVTSAWHMPRAMELCRHFKVNAIACPADFLEKPEPGSHAGYDVWELESLERSTKAIHEYLGLLWLKLRGK
jgi:uncharacterized SAM-binding protein YcdF (DUF218 family)